MCVLSKEGVSKYLKVPCHLIVEQTVTSTNTVLKQLADNGAEEFTVLVAAQQTQGRGRMGRSFFSPNNSGIYLSVLLRPQLTADRCLTVTVKAAVAVARAIERLSSKKAYIKWVNDIYVDDKKVCGILTEASTKSGSTQLDYAVVGIGVDITPHSDLPEELKHVVGSVFDVPPEDIRNKMAAQIVNEYANVLHADITHEYRSRSWLSGAEVNVMNGQDAYRAKVVDIDDDCNLIVLKEDGEKVTVFSGEVSVRKI